VRGESLKGLSGAGSGRRELEGLELCPR